MAGGSVERIIEVMNLLGRYGFVFVTLQHPVKITQLPLKSHMRHLKLRRLVMYASIVDCMGRIEFAERFEKRLMFNCLGFFRKLAQWTVALHLKIFSMFRALRLVQSNSDLHRIPLKMANSLYLLLCGAN